MKKEESLDKIITDLITGLSLYEEIIDEKGMQFLSEVFTKDNINICPINEYNTKGLTLLFRLAMKGIKKPENIEKIITLCKNLDANFNSIERDEEEGNTAILWAIANGNNETVYFMLKIAGKELNLKKSYKDNSPLPFLIAKGYINQDSDGKKFNMPNCSYFDLAKKILEIDPSTIETTSTGGNTPLHLAFTKRDKDLVEYLIAQGANQAIKNKDGKKPFEMLDLNFEESRDLFDSITGKKINCFCFDNKNKFAERTKELKSFLEENKKLFSLEEKKFTSKSYII